MIDFEVDTLQARHYVMDILTNILFLDYVCFVFKIKYKSGIKYALKYWIDRFVLPLDLRNAQNKI